MLNCPCFPDYLSDAVGTNFALVQMHKYMLSFSLLDLFVRVMQGMYEGTEVELVFLLILLLIQCSRRVCLIHSPGSCREKNTPSRQ
jgi:hypothetical protein